MVKILPLIFMTAAISLASANASKSNASSSAVGNRAFNVFFVADKASLTPEGKAIVSQAAKQFMDSHGPDARIFVISNATDGELPAKRADMVKDQLERDGLKPPIISAVDRFQVEPASLQEWEKRRIVIAIRENPAVASAAN